MSDTHDFPIRFSPRGGFETIGKPGRPAKKTSELRQTPLVLRPSVLFHELLERFFQMAVSVHARGILLTDSLRNWVEDRVGNAISRLGRQGHKASVTLFDENGPNRGGEDKACRVVVHLARHGTLVVEDKDVHIHALIDRVCDRISMAVDKRTARLREHRKSESLKKLVG